MSRMFPDLNCVNIYNTEYCKKHENLCFNQCFSKPKIEFLNSFPRATDDSFLLSSKQPHDSIDIVFSKDTVLGQCLLKRIFHKLLFSLFAKQIKNLQEQHCYFFRFLLAECKIAIL